MSYKSYFNSIKKFLSFLAVASLSISSTRIFAQENNIFSSPKPEEAKGFYGTLGLGYSATQDVTGTTKIDEIIPTKLNYGFNGGFAGETGIGYDFVMLRTELTYI